MEDSQVFVGIDGSKICLHVAARPTGEGWQVANDAAGIRDLAQQLPYEIVHFLSLLRCRRQARPDGPDRLIRDSHRGEFLGI